MRFLSTGLLLLLAACGRVTDMEVTPPDLPEVSFVHAGSTVDEKTGTKEILLALSSLSTSVVSVGVEISSETATRGQDYEIASSLVTFPPGTDIAKIEIQIVDDNLEENEEAVNLKLGNAEGAILGGQVDYVLKVSASLLPRIGFQSPQSEAVENAGMQTILVAIDQQLPVPVLVSYIWGGTASAADHSLPRSGMVVIPANQSSVNIAIPVINDIVDEYDETVDISLREASVGLIDSRTAHHLHTIADDDAPPTISFWATSSSQAEAGYASIYVSLSSHSGKPISAQLEMIGGTAGIADFTAPLAGITLQPGEREATVSISVVDDLLDEDNETIGMVLRNATNVTIGSSSHVLTIIDNDDPPFVGYDPVQSDLTVGEGNAGSFTYMFPVVLSVASGRTVTVGVNAIGTATLGSDYNFAAGDVPVVFQPGETSRMLRVAVNGDVQYEPFSEFAQFELHSPSNAYLNGNAIYRTITIADDE